MRPLRALIFSDVSGLPRWTPTTLNASLSPLESPRVCCSSGKRFCARVANSAWGFGRVRVLRILDVVDDIGSAIASNGAHENDTTHIA